MSRTIWTGDGYPRFTSTVILGTFASPGTPTNIRRLGIPAPAGAATAVAQTQERTDSSVASEFHSWVYTYVSDLAEEGPPSPPSDIVERTFDYAGDIQTVRVSGLDTGGIQNRGIVKKRLYRTATGTTGETAYQFVAELPLATASYDDSTQTSALGEGLSTEGYTEPPVNLTGVVELPNGLLGGFSGRDVHFCEPYQPHAWPSDYVEPLPFDVVGLAAYENTVVVCTTGGAWEFSGAHPADMIPSKVGRELACVGRRTITPIGEQGVAYASPLGLALVGPGGLRLVTENSYGLDDWQALGMENAVATYHEGYYLAFLADKAIAIDPRNGEGYEFSDDASAVYLDRVRDEVFLVVGNQLEEFRTKPVSGGSNRTAVWRSKRWRGALQSPGAYQVFGEVDSLKLMDPEDPGTVRATLTPADSSARRTPKGMGLHSQWGFEITSDAKVTEVRVGEKGEMLD